MPESSLLGGVALLCGGACVLVLALTALAFLSMLTAANSDQATERMSAFAVCLLALALSAFSFASTTGPQGPFGLWAVYATQFVQSFGIPAAILQLQASAAAVIVAYLAWRFPGREG